MSVYERNGKWCVQVVEARVNGKPVRKSWTFDTKREAVEFERKKYAELAGLRQVGVSLSSQKFEDYFSEWIERKAKELKPTTIGTYRWIGSHALLPKLASVPLRDISASKVHDILEPLWASGKHALATSVKSVLGSCLADAWREGKIAENPCQRIRKPRRRSAPPQRDAFTLEELQQIVDAADPQRRPLFLFLAYSGLRPGEALALRWSDVDLSTGMIHVHRNAPIARGRRVETTPKNRAGTRRFTLPKAALNALLEQRSVCDAVRRAAKDRWRPNDFVFPGAVGNGQSLHRVRAAFAKARTRAGVRPLPMYSLRHTAASLLLAAGVPVAVAAKMMGHSVAMFCNTYSHLLPDVTREAAQQVDAWLSSRNRDSQ